MNMLNLENLRPLVQKKEKKTYRPKRHDSNITVNILKTSTPFLPLPILCYLQNTQNDELVYCPR